MKTSLPKRISTQAVTKPKTSQPKEGYLLRLFVAGASARSNQAILRVHELCATELKGGGRVEVIDIYQQPKLARANQIVATPTLIVEFPRPVRRFIGSLVNLAGLHVKLKVRLKGKIEL